MKTGPSKLKPIIGNIFREGVIMLTVSPFNNSVWPIFKPGKNKDASQWVTKILMPLSYLLRSLPNISEIVGCVQTARGKYFTFEDLADKCCVQCPLLQPLCHSAFISEGGQSISLHMLMAYLSHPAITHSLCRQDLKCIPEAQAWHCTDEFLFEKIH